MYGQFFGLRENPFALSPDPRYLYMSLRHQEALAHLIFGINQGGGFVQLTGEVGTGKTMIVRALLERLPEETQVALILYPMLSVEEFIAAICDDLGVPRSGNAESVKALIDTLNRFLLESHAQGRRTVLIIDEAHKLSRDVLEQIRLLTNLETTKEKLLQILLVGQPELIGLLKQPDLRQLAQRITARYNLRALLPRETAEYVYHRLKVAGAANTIFTRGALAWVHRCSGGIPRLVNSICDRALLGAYARGQHQVNAAMVRHAAGEIGHGEPLRFPWRIAAAAAIVVAVLAGGWHWYANARSTVHAAPVASAAPMPAPATSAKESALPPTSSGQSATALTALLDDTNAVLDTDSAFDALFAQWGKKYGDIAGATGCERAQKVGLQCVYNTGTWNNLRLINRPAVIELVDKHDRRHHVLVRGLNDERVMLDIQGEAREYALSDVEPFWYGKFLSLWAPPPTGEAALRRGMRGPGVLWVRNALARYHHQTGMPSTSDVYDVELETQVKDFQREHRLTEDGIAGRSTLVLLATYAADPASPLLVKTSIPDIRMP